jgi:nicotinamide-nucleotide amidase
MENHLVNAALCAQLAHTLTDKHWTLATAESCSGGLIAAACTDLGGSSAWFERGFVTYSNEAKTESLGVDPTLISGHGAVSEAVVLAMARGALVRSRADVSIAVTGIAGPGGGSAEKPVGMVWFGWSIGPRVAAEVQIFAGDRAAVRAATVEHALRVLLRELV